MKYHIVHKTDYHYGSTVALCHNEARLTPRTLPGQTCHSSHIEIDPQASAPSQRLDFWGNQVTYFAIQMPHQRLQVTATSQVELESGEQQLDFAGDIPWEEMRARLVGPCSPQWQEARLLAMESRLVALQPELAAYARPSFPPGRPLLEGVGQLTGRIFADFTFDPSFTTVSTPLSQVLEHRRGVCQDFAHLAIGCLRSLGLAARYVSGYIQTLPPPGQKRLVGADASHAWFSVFAPGQGWIDFDPTNNQRPHGQHITVAWGRDYADVAPFKGVVFGGGQHRLDVSVDVEGLQK
ncbi:MAG: transglutaminase family protein [Candidatus Latescibacteria bacterium]|nr:transglutaminase family protein [Candidatus Latescibacterota bacterium]